MALGAVQNDGSGHSRRNGRSRSHLSSFEYPQGESKAPEILGEFARSEKATQNATQFCRDPRLAALIRAWDHLPETVKAEIAGLASGVK
jgi:hypothetical protein